MIEDIETWDQRLFLALNDNHAPWLDPVMYWVTDTYFWYPMYAVLIALVIRAYKKQGVFMVLAAILAVGLADYAASGILKPFFERLRPCHVADIQKSVFVLRGCGGKYGFVSSHASTTFALATSLFVLARGKMNWLFFLFPWAALVAYSRIYVGVHYPLDILAGAGVGVLCAWLILFLYRIVLGSS